MWQKVHGYVFCVFGQKITLVRGLTVNAAGPEKQFTFLRGLTCTHFTHDQKGTIYYTGGFATYCDGNSLETSKLSKISTCSRVYVCILAANTIH